MSNIFENKGAIAVTIVVAASNSLNKGAANYVCDGVADDVEINAALAALPAGGGSVVLSEGNFATIANITVPANATLEGQGKATIITPTGAAITNGIVLNGNNITLKDMKVILAAGAGTAPGFRPNVVYATGRTLLWVEDLWLVGDTTVGDDGSDLRQNGVYLETCTYCKVVNCQSQTNKRNGIFLESSSNNTIAGNTCQGNTTKGIFLDASSDYNTVTGNICHGNGTCGISLEGSSYSTVAGNTCYGNTIYGIYIDASSDNNTITGNTCYGNISCGISLRIASNNTIAGNTCQGNTIDGIYLRTSLNNTITGNTCQGNGTYGIYLEVSSDNNTITGNTCQGNGSHNIYIFRSSYCVITGNNCKGSTAGDGINVTGDVTTNSDYNTITGNACTGNASDGIEIAGGANANNNKVEGNKLQGNTGLHLRDGGTNSEIRWDVWPGMDIQEVLTQGAGKKVFIHAGAYAPIANLTVSANTLVSGDGKATIITPTGAAITNGIVLNGDNITLKDMKVILAAGAGTAPGFRPNVVYATGRTQIWLEDLWIVGDTSVADDTSDLRQCGILFDNVDDSKIAKCRVEDNRRHGILLYIGSDNNTVSGNTVQGNTLHGIFLYTAVNNTITSNTVQGNTRGICLLTNSNNNTITGNTVQGNLPGMRIETSSYNTITGNTIVGNTQQGIYIRTAPNNTITGNTCDSNGGAATFPGINIESSSQCVVLGNQCRYSGLHGIYIYRSSYCTVTGNGCHANRSGDGINVTGDVTANSDYNTITGNGCTLNASNGVEIVGGVRANYNMLKGNDTYGNTARGILDAGTNTIFDQAMHSIALDLTGGATDIEAFFAKCPCILAGYSAIYSVATGAGAGVNIRVGRYQDGVALDDDYFDVSVSEINKNKGYSKHFASADLTQTVIAAGDTVTVGTAGAKADTGKVILILEIAEMSN